MAKKTPRWVKFVGIVAVVVVLVGIGIGAGSFFFVRSSVRQFQAADRSFDVIAHQHGEIDSYLPPPDGVIAAERMEAFLAARDKIEPRRERTERALTLLSGDKSDQTGLLPGLRGTVGLVRNLAPLHRERNEALMEAGVGLGEYYYLYTLAYYSWLGKSPADGPSFEIVGENGFLLETVEAGDEPVVRRNREEQARRSLNRLLLPVLRNQLAGLSVQEGSAELQGFEESLAREIAALEADPRRFPWQDGLPAVVEHSLDPYRERLNESYSSLCNAIEIGLARREPQPVGEAGQAGTPSA